MGFRGQLFCLVLAAAAYDASAVQGNPMRKVVNLLQGMSKEAELEGERATELFDKYMCYCKTNSADLSKSIEAATSHVDELQSGVQELSGSSAQLEQELKDLNEDVAENTKAVEEAMAQRTREASEFAAESTEASNSIGALDKAIPALKAGLATPAAVLAQLGGMVARAPAEQASMLQGMMSGESSLASSDQILGILEQMRDDFKANLAESTKSEQDAIHTFSALSGAKNKQIQASTAEINEKTGRLASQKQQVADFTEDLEDTNDALSADQEFLGTLKKACAAKTHENEEQNKARNAELVAISEAVKILNDDDALEMFKKTLPSPELLQAPVFLQARMKSHRHLTAAEAVARHQARAAASMLRSAAGSASGVSMNAGALSLLALRLETRRQPGQGFGPLKASVSQMISDMANEQADDDKQLVSCNKNLDASGDEKATLESTLSSEQSKIEALDVEIKKREEEIAGIKVELGELDKALQDATEQRNKEKVEFTKTMSELSISSNLMMKAKSVLEKMYSPKKAEMLMQQRSRSSEWEDSLFGAAQPGAPPETASYEKKGGAGMGVVGLLAGLLGDIKTQQMASEMTETEAVKDFEALSGNTNDASDAKNKDLTGKESEKSRLEETLLDVQSENTQTTDEHGAVVSKIQALHSSCDFLIQNFEERKKARGDEVASLNNALAILSGADLGPPPMAESA